jgi:hypothetical protein
MSIAAATRRGLAVDTPQGEERLATPAVQSAIEKVTAWIPTEVVTIYTALLGILTPDTSGGRWGVFAVGAVAVPFFVILNAVILNKRAAAKWKQDGKTGDPPKFSWGKAGGVAALSALSYVAWTFALPSSPWLDASDKAPQIGGAAVVVLSLVIPKVAEALNLDVQNP